VKEIQAVSSSLKSGASSPTTMTAPPPPPPFQATTSYLAELKILGPLRTSRFSSSSGRTHHQPTPTHDLLICHDVTENKVRTFHSSDGNQEGAAASGIVPDDERYREKLRL
jgi:hypothetical protein